MEDDIRELVAGTPVPVPLQVPVASETKSPKSRSKSTTAKNKKKKKSSDGKSKSKSTATAKTKRSTSTPTFSKPETLTVQIPSEPVVSDSAPNQLATTSCVSDNLREVIGDSTIPSVKPNKEKKSSSKSRRADSSKKEKKGPKKSTVTADAAAATAAKLKKDAEEEEVAEKKKRRERLLVSPFEYLQIQHIPKTNSEEFHDDISFLTLPKPLRNLEAKAAKKVAANDPPPRQPIMQTDHYSNATSTEKNIAAPVKAPANTSKSTSNAVSPTPGWSRRSKPERNRISMSQEKQKEEASTDSPLSPQQSSILSAHHDRSSSLVTATTQTTNTKPPEINDDERNPLRRNSPIETMEPNPSQRIELESMTENSTKNADKSPIVEMPSSNEATDSNVSNKRSRQASWLASTSLWTRHTIEVSQRTLSDDVESGKLTSQGPTHFKTIGPVKKIDRFWFLATAAVCFFLVVIITAVLIVLLAPQDPKDIDQDTTENSSTPNDIFAEEFVYSDPIRVVEPEQQTTYMADIGSNCGDLDQQEPDINGNAKFAHILDQCQCNDFVQYLPQDVSDMRDILLEAIIPPIYGPLEDLIVPSASSCHPTNLALLWLASGDNWNTGYLLQRFVLSLFYFVTVGVDWYSSNDWLTSSIECSWWGVECNSNDAIVNIAIETNNIQGTIPTEFGLLGGLEAISLGGNRFRGTIPTQLFGLPRLRALWLHENEMNGPIPSEINNATSLQSLILSNNLLGGGIPAEIGYATALTDLNLSFNQFGRQLPGELGQLTRLQSLQLNDNLLSGIIPREMSLMMELQNITMSNNGFIGSVPSEFGRLKRLRDFKINGAGVGGNIPTELGLLAELQVLQMSSNRLSGPVPTQLGQLRQLSDLMLNDNTLTGTIPFQLGKLTSLEYLSLDANDLVGSIPEEMCQLFQAGGLETLVVDCPNTQSDTAITCLEDGCCSFCRPDDRFL